MKKFKILIGFTAFMPICTFGITNADAATSGDFFLENPLEITEEWVPSQYDGEAGHLEFMAHNALSNIWEFAVGNNMASGSYVDESNYFAPSYLTQSAVATKDENGQWTVTQNWQDFTDGTIKFISRDLDWLEGVPEFNQYSSAFLYTSYTYDSQNDSWGYTGVLEHGIWDDNGWTEWQITGGYQGFTAAPESVFVANQRDDGVFVGTTSAVPLPGAVWLLGTGLCSIAAARRYKKIL